MLVQLHCQAPKPPYRSKFLMQGVVNADEDSTAWYALCKQKWEELKHLRPKDWIPMVCTETSRHFVVNQPNNER